MARVAVLVLVAVVLLAIASQVMANDVTVLYKNKYGQVTITVPDPANECPDGIVRPYTHFTHYMSIRGFVRMRVWQTEHRWIQ